MAAVTLAEQGSCQDNQWGTSWTGDTLMQYDNGTHGMCFYCNLEAEARGEEQLVRCEEDFHPDRDPNYTVMPTQSLVLPSSENSA